MSGAITKIGKMDFLRVEMAGRWCNLPGRRVADSGSFV